MIECNEYQYSWVSQYSGLHYGSNIVSPDSWHFPFCSYGITCGTECIGDTFYNYGSAFEHWDNETWELGCGSTGVECETDGNIITNLIDSIFGSSDTANNNNNNSSPIQNFIQSLENFKNLIVVGAVSFFVYKIVKG